MLGPRKLADESGPKRSTLAIALTIVASVIGVQGVTPTPAAAAAPTELQAVYVIPSDVAPVAGRTSATSDTVLATQGWFESELGGVYPVFHRDESAIVVPTVVLNESTAQLFALTASGVDATVTAQIEAAVVGAAERELLVFLEAEVDISACGYRSSLIMIPIPNCDIAPLASAVFPSGATYLVAHELTHMLGAARSCGSNYDGTGHVNDDNRDIIYNGSGGRDWANLMLDPGNDDYLDHGIAGCGDIRNSPLLGQWTAPTEPIDPIVDPVDPDQPGNCRQGPVDSAYDTANTAKAAVYRLYCAYFLRFPESSGYAFWYDEFSSNRRDLNNISNFFASSPEFDERYGNLTDAEFVELIYRNVMQREAEPGGEVFWNAQLAANNYSRGEVMLFFSQSDEFRQATGS